MFISGRQRGFTLIELIVFIVIVSVALVGVLTVLNVTAKSSADPMIRKQMLTIAEALLDEVQSQPFTWCDPDDPQAATATSNAVGASGCFSAATVEAIGVETVSGNTDDRLSASYPYDNVSDYNGLSTTTGVTGIPMPPGYSATVAVAQDALNGIAATESLLITVTASHGTDSIALQGYRTRYSPNTLP